jgi:hypothetical protein
MKIDEKLAMFGKIFVRAATDWEFRERLLASEKSAIAAFAEEGDVDLPQDFSPEFIDGYDSDVKSNRVILKLPAYGGTAANLPPDHFVNTDTVLCTYAWWSPSRKP